MGDNIKTDNDLTGVTPGGRKAHVHNHPPIILDLTFDYKRTIGGREIIGQSSTHLPVLNIGVDAVDKGLASPSGLRSAVVNGQYIYLYNGIWDQTIRFNRKN